MDPGFLHTLNIATLAGWLSLGSFGAVAITVSIPEASGPDQATDPLADARLDATDFTLGWELPGAAAGSPEGATELPAEAPESALEDLAEMAPLPAPPDLEPLPDFAPLPEIPAPRAVAPRAASKPSRSSTPPARPAASGSTGGPTRSATAGGARGGSGAGLSDSARLAAGRMSPPVYPAAARRAGQTGTVVVEFTVDTSGRVIAARAVRPSPHPLLNDEAVRTVRRWKFPPGGVMKLQRPIEFKLR